MIFPKCLYTVFSNLLISFQPLPVYYFFKQSLRFFTRELIALSTKINAMDLSTLYNHYVLCCDSLYKEPPYMLSTPSELL